LSHVATITASSRYGVALYDQDGAQDNANQRDPSNDDVAADTDGDLDDPIMHLSPVFPFTLELLRNSNLTIGNTMPDGATRHQISFSVDAVP
jgi:hypothetical protein